jgi:gamma-glutamyltranspeptidase/glutathione hydrolase
VADAEGYWVACTATINTTWGSLETIPGTGVILNNEMDDFAIAPGTPNAFGLVGAEANAVAPGKRPLSSMSPTIVLRDGKPVFTVGAAGGPTIITQAVLAIVRFVDFGLSPQAALAGARFHQQWRPDALRIEKSVPEATREELKKRGHQLNVVDSMGAAQAISSGPEGFQGSSDPRGTGKAAGF